jgi:hypothetical protein
MRENRSREVRVALASSVFFSSKREGSGEEKETKEIYGYYKLFSRALQPRRECYS